jgi:hypothetical protein
MIFNNTYFSIIKSKKNHKINNLILVSKNIVLLIILFIYMFIWPMNNIKNNKFFTLIALLNIF